MAAIIRAKRYQFTPEQQNAFDIVDAIREVLGFAPLYASLSEEEIKLSQRVRAIPYSLLSQEEKDHRNKLRRERNLKARLQREKS